MAKKKKKSSRSSGKCPEPFNTLIDIAGGITMNAIADKMEKKHQYRKRGVPNPYRASAFGIASGRMKSTGDIIRLGGALGAMGAFDDDSEIHSGVSRVDTSWEYEDITIKAQTKNTNKYAWRLNCEDGSQFGIHPEDYETRTEYNEALRLAKAVKTDSSELSSPVVHQDRPDSDSQASGDSFIYCRISRLDNGENQYYLSSSSSIKVGDLVTVPTESGIAQGVVLSVEYHTAETAPIPPDDAMKIVG